MFCLLMCLAIFLFKGGHDISGNRNWDRWSFDDKFNVCPGVGQIYCLLEL